MKLIPVGQQVSGGDVPEAVSFDGVDDYLSRSSDLVGNTNSKTCTFSCWVYIPTDFPRSTNAEIYSVWNDNASRPSFTIRLAASTSEPKISAAGYDVSDNIQFTIASDYGDVVRGSWNSIIVSCDGIETVGQLYINDKPCTSDINHIGSNNIYFKGVPKYVGDGYYTLWKGRLAHLFLDYTYRDLSIEANRRLFITEDLKPADGLASLSPILYLPMKDADTAGDNLGTGGDFTINGTLDTAGRGPNQWNCVASYFDGSDDYLRVYRPTMSSNKMTVSFNMKFVSGGTTARTYGRIFSNCYGASVFSPQIDLYVYDDIRIFLKVRESNSSTYAAQLAVYLDDSFVDRNLHVVFSFDTTTSTAKVFINGVDTPISYESITADAIYDMEDGQYCYLKAYEDNSGITYNYEGSIGEFYLEDEFYDLATTNPFWDADNNRAKPVRQVINETGNTPLIAMPLSADNPVLNIGTYGDFTLYGESIGARGASEYISRAAHVDGENNNLESQSLTTNSKTFTLCMGIKPTYSSSDYIISFGTTALGHEIGYLLRDDSSNFITMRLDNSSGTHILEFTTDSSSFHDLDQNLLMVSIDLTDTAKREVYISGNSETSEATWTTYIDDLIAFNLNKMFFLPHNTDISHIYFSTDYIDFSDEENRNLFVDQLGYPKDLTPHITAGTIPNPLIYMKFDDPDDLGANSGTGGDFTVNGTVTAGSDFTL